MAFNTCAVGLGFFVGVIIGFMLSDYFKKESFLTGYFKKKEPKHVCPIPEIMLNAPIKLDADQTAKLLNIRKNIKSFVDDAMRELCKNKSRIVDQINFTVSAIKQRPPPVPVCQLLKLETMKLIEKISNGRGPDLDLLTKPQKDIMVEVMNLYLSKYLSVYCAGATFDVDLMSRQLLKAVDDICSPESDLKPFIVNNLEYAIMKPLSIMSS